MTKTKMITKKALSLFTAVLICLSLLPSFTFSGYAVDGIQMRLEKLKEKYPDGKYWNHLVKTDADILSSILENRNESYAESITSYPCADHESESGKGYYVCNYFDEGYQCHGFAARLFYEIFGVRQSSLDKVDSKVHQVQPGDLVRLKNNTHSAIVLSVDGLRLTVAECNVASFGELPSCEISWGRSLSVSDITYYVHAPNYEQVKSDTNWKSVEKKQNQGSQFYAAIVNGKSKKALTVDSSGKLVISAYTGAKNQMWNFTRLSNGSYKIISCLNSLALTINGNGTRSELSLNTYEDSSFQRWAFYAVGSSLLISADCSQSVLCVEGGVYDDGTKVWATENIKHSAQLYTLRKRNQPSASTITAKGGVNKASLSWTRAEGAVSYTVKIYRDGKLYKNYVNVSVLSGNVSLPSGTYSVTVYSNNDFVSVKGNTAYFTVGDNGKLGKTAKVSLSCNETAIKLSWTPVPQATGYRIYYKSGGKWKTGATVTGTTHTFKKLSAGSKFTFAVKAYRISGEKVTWSDSYTEFTAATKTSAPKNVTSKQSTTAIKLSWQAVKNADGYRIYYKTADGWKAHSTTTATSKTFNGLKSAKEYTFAVRPYIKTTLGVVYGNYTQCKTATKPTAPVLQVGNVKGLSAEITWKEVTGADGYQLFYKLDNTDYTLLNEFSKNTMGVKITEMSRNVYYTFAVRAYKKVGNTRIYGAHSEVRIKSTLL